MRTSERQNTPHSPAVVRTSAAPVLNQCAHLKPRWLCAWAGVLGEWDWPGSLFGQMLEEKQCTQNMESWCVFVCVVQYGWRLVCSASHLDLKPNACNRRSTQSLGAAGYPQPHPTLLFWGQSAASVRFRPHAGALQPVFHSGGDSVGGSIFAQGEIEHLQKMGY